MRKIIYGQDKMVTDWVAAKVDEDAFGDCSAIGLEQDGELIAGVVYNIYTKAGINMHVAADTSKNWLSRDFLFAVFAYPFIQLECFRVTGLVRADNIDARRFDEHLGFKQEGVIRRGATDGTDMILYGMLKEECRWLGVKR